MSPNKGFSQHIKGKITEW